MIRRLSRRILDTVLSAISTYPPTSSIDCRRNRHTKVWDKVWGEKEVFWCYFGLFLFKREQKNASTAIVDHLSLNAVIHFGKATKKAMFNCLSIIVGPAELLHLLRVHVCICTWACVVFPYISPVFTTLSTAGFKAQLKPERHKHVLSFVNTDCPLNLNMFHGGGQSSSCENRTFVGSACRRCSLPWGRTGCDAPPYKWFPGSPELQCSCCKSSACLHSGRLWSPAGLNDWWCLDILQGNKQISGFFPPLLCLAKIKTSKCHKSSVVTVAVNVMTDKLARCHMKKYNLKCQLLMTECWVKLSWLYLLGLYPKPFRFFAGLLKQPFQPASPSPLCHFREELSCVTDSISSLVSPRDFGSVDFRFNNSSQNPQPPFGKF